MLQTLIQRMYLYLVIYLVFTIATKTEQKSKFNYFDFVKQSPPIDIPQNLQLYTPHPPTVVVNGKTKDRAGEEKYSEI